MRSAGDRGAPRAAPSASLTRRALALRHALSRFLFAAAGSLLAGAGFLWALVDREGLFLHDRLAGTKIIMNDE